MTAHILSHDDETIIAQCTPLGSGALALLRISGAQAIEVATSLSKLASGKKLTNLPTHTIHYGNVVDAHGTTIDHVMFLLMHAPRTFTGQNTVEITCHNNPFIVQNIIAQAITHGARLAQEGEFSKRAVLNNKIDLVQAEAINELIHANTHMALKKSLAQLEGSFSHWITTIEKELTLALALSEASFEFIDEEMEFGDRINTSMSTILATINTLKKDFDQQQQIRQGVRIALVGSVNAGKSSLFNALLNKKRAIVTDVAGTTRDSIEAGMYKNSSYWTLIDTAGLRKTNDVIEQEGISRSGNEAHQADIILLVIDSARAMTHEEDIAYKDLIAQYAHKIIVVYNKLDAARTDTPQFTTTTTISVSSTERTNLAELECAVEAKITELFANADAPFLLNQRQFKLLLSLEHKLLETQKMLVGPIQYELLSYYLNDALAHLSELTGKSISEAGMDAVFREFCVGK